MSFQQTLQNLFYSNTITVQINRSVAEKDMHKLLDHLSKYKRQIQEFCDDKGMKIPESLRPVVLHYLRTMKTKAFDSNTWNELLHKYFDSQFRFKFVK